MFDRYTIEILDSYFKGPIDEYHFVHNLDGVMDCMMSKRGGVVHMYNTLSENLLEYLRARRISDEDEKLLLMTIMMNSHGIFFPEDNMEEIYKLVTTVRSNSMKGRVSIESPLGKAIYGHKVNERVVVQINQEVSYEVIIKKIDKSENEDNDEISKY